MRVVVAGSSGLIGTALVAHLRGAGHEVLRLVRRTPAAPDLTPNKHGIGRELFEAFRQTVGASDEGAAGVV